MILQLIQNGTNKIEQKKYHIDEKPCFLMNSGASYGTAKFWMAEGFARTADLLSDVSMFAYCPVRSCRIFQIDK